jgi:hypothetical protein
VRVGTGDARPLAFGHGFNPAMFHAGLIAGPTAAGANGGAGWPPAAMLTGTPHPSWAQVGFEINLTDVM